MKNTTNLYFLIVCALFAMPMHAKLYTPDFERNFFNQLERHDLAIVHFNPYAEDESFVELDRMKDGFAALSKTDRYRGADVGFIGVNLNKLQDLAQDFGIEPQVTDTLKEKDEEKVEVKPSQQATVMLFKDGKPLKEGDKIVKRVGFMTKSEIEDFIEAYFGNYIDSILKGKRDAERERERVRVVQPTVTRTIYRYPTTYDSDYYRPYWGGYYGRPWGGWRGGWGGSGAGFGFGFGGGRRGGFRGGFGFGW